MVDRFAHDNRTSRFEKMVRQGVAARKDACHRAIQRMNKYGFNDPRFQIHLRRCQSCAAVYTTKS